jgi:glutamate carboxypeptidase
MSVKLMDSSKTALKLRDYLHQRREEMVELLDELVKIESPSSVPQTQTKIFTILGDAFKTQGYRLRLIPGRDTGGHLLAIPGSRLSHQPIQLLIGHSDTVWPLGTLRTMPANVKEGKFYGPGVYDMKAGLVFMIFAVKAIQAHELHPEVAPVIFINSDEEIGSNESRNHIIRLARRADRALVLEPSLGVEGKLKTRRKGVGQFTIHVIGKASHAGLAPEKGISAILELSFLVQKLFALNDPPRGISVNVGNIDGGIRPNVVAPQSKAVVDVRVLNQEDAARIEETIRNLTPSTPGAQLIVEGGFERPPLEKTPANERLWQIAQQAASELGMEIEQATAGGGSDGNYTSLYTATLDGLGAVGDNAHSLGEFVYLEQMVERTALLSQLLLTPSLKKDVNIG